MKLSAPTRSIWLLSVILAALGVIGKIVLLPVVSVYAFWILVAGYILLFLSTVLKGF